MKPPVTDNPWADWRQFTPARLALGRAGAGMPTDETLRFGWAHATARDAVHAALDVDRLTGELVALGFDVERVRSRAADRTTYLRRPDLGRQLDAEDAERLRELVALKAASLSIGVADSGSGEAIGTGTVGDSNIGTGEEGRSDGVEGGHRSGDSGFLSSSVPPDVCIVVGDGLSSLAIERHAAPLLAALRTHLPPETRFSPVVIATQARVALGDEPGEIFGARLLVMLIGERPGLSSPDSLGIYLTHLPKRGKHDAERNCISNVRPEGLSYDLAAFKLAWLMRESMRRGLTGVELKDESDLAVLASTSHPASIAVP
ncbi:MAG: eutC [Rhizobacter sp.]|nr:eutC [Rhizobacter sp.]